MADLLQPVAPQPWRARLAGLRDQAPPWALAVAVLAGAVAVAVVALLALRGTSAPAPLTLPQATPDGGAPAPTGPSPSVAAEVATVHVAGQVHEPGVYAVPAGGRVADALAAAGGPQPDADLDQLNLAARVADGDRVFVTRKGETPPAGVGGSAGMVGGAAGSSTTRPGPVDLNTATPEQLDVLPGVGPATAKAIVDYRTRHGRFRSVTELLEVPGIGPAKLEALRPLVRT